MKGQQINFRADPKIVEEFCRNARILGHSLSSLVMALMQATNLHMANHGELTFPIEFASKRDKMLIHLGEIHQKEIAKDMPDFPRPAALPQLGMVAEPKPVMETTKNKKEKRK